jgi:hypothetical protein
VAIDLPQKAQKSQNEIHDLNLWRVEVDQHRIYYCAVGKAFSHKRHKKHKGKNTLCLLFFFVAIDLPHNAQKSQN